MTTPLGKHVTLRRGEMSSILRFYPDMGPFMLGYGQSTDQGVFARATGREHDTRANALFMPIKAPEGQSWLAFAIYAINKIWKAQDFKLTVVENAFGPTDHLAIISPISDNPLMQQLMELLEEEMVIMTKGGAMHQMPLRGIVLRLQGSIEPLMREQSAIKELDSAPLEHKHQLDLTYGIVQCEDHSHQAFMLNSYEPDDDARILEVALYK